jgi:hypothetical protein
VEILFIYSVLVFTLLISYKQMLAKDMQPRHAICTRYMLFKITPIAPKRLHRRL